MFDEILQKYQVEAGYEIPRESKHIDFYLEERNVPINAAMDYLKIFAKYNLMQFKSVEDSFEFKDIVQIHAYLSDYLLSNQEKDGQLHFIQFCSLKPQLLFEKYEMTQIKQGVYQTMDFKMAPFYLVVISELPAGNCEEVDKIRLCLPPEQAD